MSDASVNANEAVQRGLIAYNSKLGTYWLGAGDYNPLNDVPWTKSPIGLASDCRFAFLFCWKTKSHRPGYNKGNWATVEDDINYNSLIEDGQHRQELCVTLGSSKAPITPQPGDIVTYPTHPLKDDHGNYLRNADGSIKYWIGHGALVIEVPDDYQHGEGWHRLTLLQCHGPEGFKPGVVKTDGSVFDMHDHNWPKDEHRTQLVRPKERK